MKILLFGKNGQLGQELCRCLQPWGEFLALDVDSRDDCGDFTRLQEVKKTVERFSPQIIVNAAAYTAVDLAETEPNVAYTINALAPTLLAACAHKIGAWLVHYSSDYVFDGSGQVPWKETDTPHPLNVYGQTKWAGDQAILQSGCAHLIFRSSWIYSSRGQHFLNTLLDLASQKKSIDVVNDQFGAPTSATLLAHITTHCLQFVLKQKKGSGLYHVAARGITTWFEYAQCIVEAAHASGYFHGLGKEVIHPVTSAAFFSKKPLPYATRPLNSRLDTAKLETAFHLTLPHWKIDVINTVQEILSQPFIRP